MLKIRLTRRGKKNKAFFRLVVAEHTSPIKGRFVEALGFLNPHTKEKKFEEDRIKYWIEKGAQCSDSVHNMLVSAGIVKGPKKAVKMKKAEEKKIEDSPVEEKKGEKKEEELKSEANEEKTEAKVEDKKEEKQPEEAKIEKEEKPEVTKKEAKEEEKSEEK
jgi:small subunit ribosomal protein S16